MHTAKESSLIQLAAHNITPILGITRKADSSRNDNDCPAEK